MPIHTNLNETTFSLSLFSLSLSSLSLSLSLSVLFNHLLIYLFIWPDLRQQQSHGTT